MIKNRLYYYITLATIIITTCVAMKEMEGEKQKQKKPGKRGQVMSPDFLSFAGNQTQGVTVPFEKAILELFVPLFRLTRYYKTKKGIGTCFNFEENRNFINFREDLTSEKKIDPDSLLVNIKKEGDKFAFFVRTKNGKPCYIFEGDTCVGVRLNVIAHIIRSKEKGEVDPQDFRINTYLKELYSQDPDKKVLKELYSKYSKGELEEEGELNENLNYKEAEETIYKIAEKKLELLIKQNALIAYHLAYKKLSSDKKFSSFFQNENTLNKNTLMGSNLIMIEQEAIYNEQQNKIAVIKK